MRDNSGLGTVNKDSKKLSGNGHATTKTTYLFPFAVFKETLGYPSTFALLMPHQTDMYFPNKPLLQ